MSDGVIRVENLSKKYQLGRNAGQNRAGYRTLRETLSEGAQRLFRNPKSAFGDSGTEEFWALRDVSFDVKQGEVVGIIGRNGAGKSTLLKILSRITEPTTGRISIQGRVASLLEVGTGFHQELTGRENIFLNGAILGMTGAEIKAKFDEIVAFAEVDKFLDTPVKRYSSGMYVRLAFAVAAHLEPEILVVDEVLAVGDAEFQQKCLGKMQDVSRSGRTVLFVSHNIGAVTQLCSVGIFLESGSIKMVGAAAEAARAYVSSSVQPDAVQSSAFQGPLSSTIRFTSLTVANEGCGPCSVISPGAPIPITVSGVASRRVPRFRVTLSLFREHVRLITMHDVEHPTALESGGFQCQFTVPPLLLRPGVYTVAVGGYRDGMHEWLWGTDLLNFTVAEEWGENYDPINIGWVNIPGFGSRIRHGLGEPRPTVPLSR